MHFFLRGTGTVYEAFILHLEIMSRVYGPVYSVYWTAKCMNTNGFSLIQNVDACILKSEHVF